MLNLICFIFTLARLEGRVDCRHFLWLIEDRGCSHERNSCMSKFYTHTLLAVLYLYLSLLLRDHLKNLETLLMKGLLCSLRTWTWCLDSMRYNLDFDLWVPTVHLEYMLSRGWLGEEWQAKILLGEGCKEGPLFEMSVYYIKNYQLEK